MTKLAALQGVQGAPASQALVQCGVFFARGERKQAQASAFLYEEKRRQSCVAQRRTISWTSRCSSLDAYLLVLVCAADCIAAKDLVRRSAAEMIAGSPYKACLHQDKPLVMIEHKYEEFSGQRA